MSIPKKLINLLQRLCHQTVKLIRSTNKRVMSWLLRRLMTMRHQLRPGNSGFVLPTVVMVILVVTLLSTAIVFRSFDRAKNAQNVRVNERVLAAAGPAIDRAQAKIKALLADPTLPRGTPTDTALYGAMTGSLPLYTLGDEDPIRLADDIDGDGNIEPNESSLDERGSLTTAWRFPVDTDNNGDFDSYTLYGLYFRNPTPGTQRARSTLEARSEPMDNATAGNACGTGTSASLVGNTGWYKTSDGNLKKSFFVVTATVPITDDTNLPTGFKTYKGNQGFAALEYQQDQARIPLTNNAVVYNDDLEITPGAGIYLIVRIMTNVNFFVGQSNAEVRLCQVSSIHSCFYNEDNGKITVGGDVVVGSADSSRTINAGKIDLFTSGAAPGGTALADGNGSVTQSADQVSFNSTAYATRIDRLVVAHGNDPDPLEVTRKVSEGADRRTALENYFIDRTRRVPFAEVSDVAYDPTVTLQGGGNTLRPPDNWIRPIQDDGTANNSLNPVFTQPPATDPKTLDINELRLGDRIQVGNGLPAKWWDEETDRFVNFYDQVAQLVDGGDTKWTNNDEPRTRMTQTIPLSDVGDTQRDGFWERKAAEAPVQPLDGVGGLRVVTGAGIYNPNGSFLPRPQSPVPDNFSTVEDESYIAPVNSDGFIVVLPDSMPMWEDDNDGNPNNGIVPDSIPQITDRRGDLVMRASVVYHYKSSHYPNSSNSDQVPIACVASYYDPSTSDTARNRATLPDGGTTPPWQPPGVTGTNGLGLSLNGITFGVHTRRPSTLGGGGRTPEGAFNTPAPSPPGTGTLRGQLNYQANLIFPDGRFVNQPLREALIQHDSGDDLTLAHQAAIDSALCSLGILQANGIDNLSPDNSVIPHGAIYETTFLDGKQVKGIESEALGQNFDTNGTNNITADYDLALEERQPLEIRATVLDLDKLRQNPTGGVSGTSVVPGTEYLLPDSGIIYATRNDALLDLSDPGYDPTTDTATTDQAVADERMATRKINSPVDFILDPTRRPNGIMLINGSTLARGTTNTWKDTEKGLILASNLPVYIKADQYGFNLHRTNPTSTTQLEEFTDTLAGSGWTTAKFYTNRTEAERNENFACRPGQPGLPCPNGDLWRPATVIADAVNLLSYNFRPGFRNEGDYDLRKNVENLNNDLVTSGYDFNPSGVTIDETSLGDLNGDTNIDTSANDSVEQTLGIDLNGDGDLIDAVGATNPALGSTIGGNTVDAVTEADITITAARRLNGFSDNNYLTSADWNNPSPTNTDFIKNDFDPNTVGNQSNSSYVNNFVTPIQRRTDFSEYVMEICRRPVVSQCSPSDWVVGYTTDGLLDTPSERDVRAWELISATEDAGAAYTVAGLGAGTTASPPLGYDADGDGSVSLSEMAAERRYPRRVAFLRYADDPPDPARQNRLVLGSNLQGGNSGPSPTPVPIGINSSEQVDYFPYEQIDNLDIGVGRAAITTITAGRLPRTQPNALWFRTTNAVNYPFNNERYRDIFPLAYTTPLAVTTSSPPLPSTDPGVGTTQQPLLVPVLQIQTLDGTPANNLNTGNLLANKDWLQTPTEATFNLIMVAGDNPNRPGGFAGAPVDEFNGGMPNFPIFLENWDQGGGNNAIPTNINGSFIQFKRSAYATAPFVPLLQNTASVFNYPAGTYRTSNSGGRTPFYGAPARAWGYDVGLLSQLPDLFSQQITTPSAGEPNAYFREVGRDDDWVQTLLCGAVDSSTYAVTNSNDPPQGSTCPDLSDYGF